MTVFELFDYDDWSHWTTLEWLAYIGSCGILAISYHIFRVQVAIPVVSHYVETIKQLIG